MATNESGAPKAFISYSWDGPEHSAWVLALATRLRSDGVDVILDQWDAVLGSDLSLFMDQAGDDEYRVLAVCSERYVLKADAGEGGVGYERRVITQSLMRDLRSTRIIPVIRSNPEKRMPKFFGTTRFADFTGEDIEKTCLELLMELHGMPAISKPALGPNPFTIMPAEAVPSSLRQSAGRYRMPALAASVSFDYDNNNGLFTVGDGDREFTLNFSEDGFNSIYMYSHPGNIEAIALAKGVDEPAKIADPDDYDWSSHTRNAQGGDAILLRNTSGYVAAVFVDKVFVRDTGPMGKHLIRFRYVIPEIPAWRF